MAQYISPATIAAATAIEDLSSETTYCSTAFRDRASSTASAAHRRFAVAAEQPIRNGWSLWARALPRIVLHSLPIAAAIAGLLVASGFSLQQFLDDEAASTISLPVTLIAWLFIAYGVAVSALILSSEHTGQIPGNLYGVAAARLLPWLATWALVIAAMLTGFILLVIPGIIASIRLFWADELALVHSASPIRACRESAALTKGRGAAVFGFQFLLGFAEYLVLVPAALLGVALIWAFSALSSTSPVAAFAEIFLAFILIFAVYGSFHAPEIVYFYGLRAKQSEPTSSQTAA